MKINEKLCLLLILTSALQIAAFLLLLPQSLLEDRLLIGSIAVSCAAGVFFACAAAKPGGAWLAKKEIQKLRLMCAKVREGNYEELAALPLQSEEENDFLLLFRDMNWMVHRLRVRETELESAIAQLSLTREELLTRQLELQKVNERLLEMAMTDPLTGLSNRRHFFQHLEQEAKRNDSAAAMLILDIDHFKKINDSLGHQAGDLVICRLAGLLQKCVLCGGLAARIGGEEFAVLLHDVDHKKACKIAQELRLCIEEYFLRGECGAKVTCSIGVCAFNGVKRPLPDEIYRKADQALYAAKMAGRNRVYSCRENGEMSRQEPA